MPPGEKIRRRGSVSRGLCEDGRDPAVGAVIGEAVRSVEYSDGAVGVLVDAHHGPDEVRPEPARRQLQAEAVPLDGVVVAKSEEHTSELQSLMRISFAVFCLKKKRCMNTI